MSGIVSYRLAESADRRLVGGILSGLGAAFLGVLWFLWTEDANPPVVRVAVLAAVGLAAVVGGGVIGVRASEVLIVDLDRRRVTSTRKQDEKWSATLDEVAPVAVIKGIRMQYNARTQRRVEYRVAPAGRPDLMLKRAWGYSECRRFAERLARQWKVGLCGLDGRIRAYNALDQTLWAVAEGFPKPVAALPESSGVVVESSSDRAVLRSSVMSRLAVAPNYLILLWTGMAALAMSELPVQVDLEQNLAARAFYWLLSAVVLGSGGLFLWQVRQWLAPSQVTIATDGVSYRGRTLPLASVREVVNVGGITIVGDRRHIAIEPEFTEPGAVDLVAAEIRRLIVDIGRRPRLP